MFCFSLQSALFTVLLPVKMHVNNSAKMHFVVVYNYNRLYYYYHYYYYNNSTADNNNNNNNNYYININDPTLILM